jgi:hypothetical protein
MTVAEGVGCSSIGCFLNIKYIITEHAHTLPSTCIV